MAIKKFELYSSLWSSCDALRGSMDASQYKDDVLVRLFVKYVSDKYAGVPYAPITIPPGASFKYMVAMKGKPDIGDQINKKIIGPLANAIYNEIDRISQALAQRVKELAERYETLLPMLTSKVADLSAKVAAHLSVFFRCTKKSDTV